MKKPIQLILIILLVFILKNSYAQLTIIDTSFKIVNAASSTVNKIDIQSNGRIIVSGDFQTFKGTNNKRIVRLLQNGTIDASFLSGVGVEGPVRASALQTDDKLIIGGLFLSYNNTSRKNLARINANGTIDSSFHTGSGPNNEVTEIFIQKDGKIIISGFFNKYDNINYTGFVRLNPNGSIDTTFNISIGTNLGPECFGQQSNNKILIGGSFLRYKGLNVSKLFRVDLNGNLDTNFNAGNIAGTVNEMIVLPNDKIIITGTFTAINGMMANRIARLNSDGSLDTSFFANFSARIRDIHLQKDGKLIVAGDFTSVNGQTVQRMVRLNTNGTLDNTIYAGTNGTIFDIAEQADKNVLIGGSFTQTTQTREPLLNNTNRLTRLENNYTVTLPCISATAPILDTIASNVRCILEPQTITVIGGATNAGSNWFWYKDSLNGTFIDSGLSITVAEQKTTQFFVTAGLTCTDTIAKFASYTLNVSDTINTEILVNPNGLLASDTNSNYQWHSCDSALMPMIGETKRLLIPAISGNYALVFTNKFGCLDTSLCINYTVLIQSINNIKRLKLANPVIAGIYLPEDINLVEVELVSVLGQIAYKNTHASDLRVIDVKNLPIGIYFLRAKDNENRLYSEKILIQ